MSISDPTQIKEQVRERYASIALQSGSCCGTADSASDIALVDYSEIQDQVVAGSDLGLGCGTPTQAAAIQPGETVLDLGSGAGIDVFLAAKSVGAQGRVIGVDMTPEMLARARANAEQGGFENVEFRLGEIEHLPVADETVDVIISNCVINLSPDKPQVFREAHRVLKPGGRLAISDVVAGTELPDGMRDDPYLHSACVAGASMIDELERMLSAAGFADIRIQPKDESREFIRDWAPGSRVEDYVLSATIEAVKRV